MTFRHATLSAALLTLALTLPQAAYAADPKPVSASEITKELQGLRAVPDAQRGARTTEIALQIRMLPAGLDQVKAAVGLTHLSKATPAARRFRPSPQRSPWR